MRKSRRTDLSKWQPCGNDRHVQRLGARLHLSNHSSPEFRMLKTLLAASTVLLVCSVQAEARPHPRHHGYRAHAWCGSYLSKYLGKPDRRLALARAWANEGYNAGGPGVGVVVVWRHHVGIITGRTPDGR